MFERVLVPVDLSDKNRRALVLAPRSRGGHFRVDGGAREVMTG